MGWAAGESGPQDVADCDEGGVRIVFDRAGELRIAQRCDGLQLMSISGHYPADYLATCATVAEEICDASCGCAGNGNCRTFTEAGSFGASPASYCPVSMNTRICGDATRDPAALYACASSLGPFQCTTDSSGEAGALLSETVCGALFTP